MPDLETALLLHAAPTLLMVGVIWIIQLVHYPMFALVPEQVFVRFEGEHCRRISWVVLPLMLAEVLFAVPLLWLATPSTTWWLAFCGTVLLAVIWLSTFLVQVPCHRRLSEAWDPAAARRLVQTNWIRTVAWTLRGVLALLLLAEC